MSYVYSMYIVHVRRTLWSMYIGFDACCATPRFLGGGMGVGGEVLHCCGCNVEIKPTFTLFFLGAPLSFFGVC